MRRARPFGHRLLDPGLEGKVRLPAALKRRPTDRRPQDVEKPLALKDEVVGDRHSARLEGRRQDLAPPFVRLRLIP